MPCTAQPVTSDSARGMNGRPPLWCLLIKGELPIFLNPAERVVRIRAVLPRHCANSGDRYGVCLGPAGPFSPPITHGGSRSLLVLMICLYFFNRGPGSSRRADFSHRPWRCQMAFRSSAGRYDGPGQVLEGAARARWPGRTWPGTSMSCAYLLTRETLRTRGVSGYFRRLRFRDRGREIRASGRQRSGWYWSRTPYCPLPICLRSW